jgi:rubrerythrin
LPTSYEIFEKAERVEQLSATLYGLLAQRFGDDPEARDLFLRLEQEELQHASRVRLMGARYRHDSRLLGRLSVDHTELDALLSESEEAIRAVQDGSFGRTMDQVRGRLAALEEHLARAHAELIAREGAPALRQFFRQLAEQDRAHQELLGELLGRR